MTDQKDASSQSFQGRDWVMVVGAALLCLVLRLLSINFRGFWLDEYYTLNAVLLPIDELIKDRFAAGHSPLPFLYAKLFTIFGTSEAALRFSSTLMAGVALIATAGLTVALGQRKLLPIICVLGIFHPYWQEIGTELRYMMPLVAMSALWFWVLVEHIKRPAIWKGVLVALLGGVVLWIHGSAVMIFLSAVFFVTMEIWRRRDLTMSRWRYGFCLAVPLLCSMASAVPLFLELSQQEKVVEENQPNFPSIRLELMNQKISFFGDEDIWSSVISLPDDIFTTCFLIFHLGSVALVIMAWRRGYFRESGLLGRLLFATLLGIPIAVMVITIFIKDAQGPARYVAFQSVPMMILLAMGWTLSGSMLNQRLSLALRIFFMIMLSSTWFLRAVNEGEGHREAIFWLKENRAQDQPVIVVTSSMNLLALNYHGVKGGTIAALKSHVDSVKQNRRIIDEAMKDAEIGFLLSYHPGEVPVGDSLGSLKKREKLYGHVMWETSDKVRLYGLAKSEDALEELKQLAGPPKPWPTSNPIEN